MEDWSKLSKKELINEIELLYFKLKKKDLVRIDKLAKESERRFTSILKSVNLVSIVLDIKGNIEFCNDYFLKITGYKQSEVLAKNWFDVFVPNNISKQIKEVFISAITDGTFVSSMENEIIDKRGSKIIIAWNNTLLKDTDEKITGVASIGENITDKRKAKIAVNQSEAKYYALFNHSPYGILIADSSSYYLDANKAMCQMLGLSHQELVGKHATDIVTPIEYKYINPALKTIQNDNTYQKEWEFKRKDKTTFVADVQVAKMPDGNLMAIVRDVTKQREAEISVRENEQRFRTIFEQSASGMCITGLDGKLIDVNLPFCDMLEYSKEELVGLHFNSITFPEDINIGNESIKKMLSLTTPKIAFEKRYLTKGGKIIWVRINTALLRDKENNPLYFITQMEDVSERVKTDQQLKISENKYKALVEQSLTGIYIFRKEGFLYVNNRFCEIFGYSEEEIMSSLKPTDVINQSDRSRAKENISKRLQGKVDSVRYIAKGKHKINQELWVEIHGTHISLEGEDVIAGTVLDITDRIKTEEKIRKINEELEGKIAERTKDLQDKITEIERLNRVFVGRELRMKELKATIKELKEQLGDQLIS